MLNQGIIQPLDSLWVSAIVMTKMKDGDWRFYIDLHTLSNINIKDTYTLPNIDDVLESLHGIKWYCSLDLKTGYWQILLKEQELR